MSRWIGPGGKANMPLAKVPCSFARMVPSDKLVSNIFYVHPYLENFPI